jgi:hypothetical protein
VNDWASPASVGTGQFDVGVTPFWHFCRSDLSKWRPAVRRRRVLEVLYAVQVDGDGLLATSRNNKMPRLWWCASDPHVAVALALA